MSEYCDDQSVTEAVEVIKDDTYAKDNTTEVVSAVDDDVKAVIDEISVNIEKPYISFFEQYLTYSFKNENEIAIKCLSNAIKAVFRENTSLGFNNLFNYFIKNKNKITINDRLRGIASLPKSDRVIVETVMTLFNIMSTSNNKKSVDLDKVRMVIKNNNFVNWCSRKLK